MSSTDPKNSTLNTIAQFIGTPKGFASISICIATSLFVGKYISTKTRQETDTDVSSQGYDSLIPFTLKQDAKAVYIGDNKFATVNYPRLPRDVQLKRSQDLLKFMNFRRSFRHFSDEPVDIEIIRNCIATANTAPSGAHTSPWTFVVVADPKKRMAIRKVVESEEQINYDRRMKKTWVDTLQPVISNLHSKQEAVSKPYLSTAPYLIIVMKEMYRFDEKTGNKIDNYYPNQSTGIATGMLMTALHSANLVSLPSTPMGAEKSIREICGRKQNEKVFLLVPVGYPAKNATIPYRTSKEWRKDMKKSMVIV